MRPLVAVLVVSLSVAAVRAQTNDHLKCYKVHDAERLVGSVDLQSPQYGASQGCSIGKTALFCVPATETQAVVTERGSDFLRGPLPVSAAPQPGDVVCYRLKCPSPQAPVTEQTVTDEFATRTISNLKASLVCNPAVKGTGFCGNGTLDPGEQCDGTNLNGATCESRGFPNGGTLACAAGCTFDTSGCQRAGLPATGQTTCWDSSGTVIACAGTGQDGDLQKGAPLAYVDNGDGTITDVNTGFMWEKLSSDGSVHDMGNAYSWDQAFSVHVATLNSTSFAGHSDWRLPNVKELVSIVNYQNVNPAVSAAFNNNCAPGCTVLTCSCIALSPNSNYLSSTANAAFPSNAWVVGFSGPSPEGGGGYVHEDANKTEGPFVRAVRGGS